MKQFTEAERAALIEYLNASKENRCVMYTVSQWRKLDAMRDEIALAALTAEPVKLDNWNFTGPLYTAPPVAALRAVVLPKSERLEGNGYGYYFDMNDVFEALDSAGVRYEVNATAPAEETK